MKGNLCPDGTVHGGQHQNQMEDVYSIGLRPESYVVVGFVGAWAAAALGAGARWVISILAGNHKEDIGV